MSTHFQYTHVHFQYTYVHRISSILMFTTFPVYPCSLPVYPCSPHFQYTHVHFQYTHVHHISSIPMFTSSIPMFTPFPVYPYSYFQYTHVHISSIPMYTTFLLHKNQHIHIIVFLYPCRISYSLLHELGNSCIRELHQQDRVEDKMPNPLDLIHLLKNENSTNLSNQTAELRLRMGHSFRL